MCVCVCVASNVVLECVCVCVCVLSLRLPRPAMSFTKCCFDCVVSCLSQMGFRQLNTTSWHMSRLEFGLLAVSELYYYVAHAVTCFLDLPCHGPLRTNCQLYVVYVWRLSCCFAFLSDCIDSQGDRCQFHMLVCLSVCSSLSLSM